MDNQHRHIKGERELTHEEIALINEGREHAHKIYMWINKLKSNYALDQRWVSEAEIDLQKGFMSATRSIAMPTTF